MTDNVRSPLQSDISHVTLHTALFQRALEEHLDKCKPDPLALRQVKEWVMEWTSKEDGCNVQSGSLEIHGEHMVVTVISRCTWSSPDTGTLSFSLSAGARFRTKGKQDRKQNKVENKIRAEMIKRLKDDDYVKPLLEEDGLALCEAHIHFRPGKELEERVRVDDNVAEGVRRSIYSQSEGTLGLMDLLVSLPLMPAFSLAQRAKLRLI
jgi:hypothetical protein